MRTPTGLLFLILALLTTSCASGRKTAVNLYGGGRTYDGDFGDVSDAPTVGLEGMIGLTRNGLSVEGGYAYAENSSSGFKLAVNEVYAGLRKTFWSDRLIQPYLGVGANYLHGSGETPGAADVSGDGIGAYLRGGVGFQIAIFQTGVDLRGSTTSADVEGENLNYLQAAIFIGLSF